MSLVDSPTFVEKKSLAVAVVAVAVVIVGIFTILHSAARHNYLVELGVRKEGERNQRDH